MVEFRRLFPRSDRERKPYGRSHFPAEERRRHPRKPCFIPVDYAVKSRVYKDFIQNISAGGALIETRRPFFIGQRFSMSFELPESQKPINIIGEVAWTGTLGIGVEFQLGQFNFTALRQEEPDSHDLSAGEEDSIEFEEEVNVMGKVKQKKIRWQPSTSLDVTTYKLYWSKLGEVSYNSDYAELGNVTEVTLPDDVPSFPLEAGDISLGVSAVNAAGNESEITKISAYFNFNVPEAPQNIEIEDL